MTAAAAIHTAHTHNSGYMHKHQSALNVLDTQDMPVRVAAHVDLHTLHTGCIGHLCHIQIGHQSALLTLAGAAWRTQSGKHLHLH